MLINEGFPGSDFLQELASEPGFKFSEDVIGTAEPLNGDTEQTA